MVKRNPGKSIVLGAGAVVTVAAVGALGYLVGPMKEVLIAKDPIGANYRLTPDMVEVMRVPSYAVPPTALTMGDIQEGELRTKVAINDGGIITAETAGEYDDISVGLPDDYVIQSFTISADRAAAGMIRRGQYFNLMVNNEFGSSRVFSNILVLQATNLEIDRDKVTSGAMQYVIGLKPEDMARFNDTIKKFGSSMDMEMTPRQNEYAPPMLERESGLYRFDSLDKADSYTLSDGRVVQVPMSINAGLGTDYTFTPLTRDDFGRPVEAVENCGEGNMKIQGELCETLTKEKAAKSTTAAPGGSKPSPSPEPSASETVPPVADVGAPLPADGGTPAGATPPETAQ